MQKFPTQCLLYSLHNGLALLHKYTSTTASEEECTNQRDTIMCDTICVVDGQSLPHWTLSFQSTNYYLTRLTCILFLLLEYICFSIKLFVFSVFFFGQHHDSVLFLITVFRVTYSSTFRWYTSGINMEMFLDS